MRLIDKCFLNGPKCQDQIVSVIIYENEIVLYYPRLTKAQFESIKQKDDVVAVFTKASFKKVLKRKESMISQTVCLA